MQLRLHLRIHLRIRLCLRLRLRLRLRLLLCTGAPLCAAAPTAATSATNALPAPLQKPPLPPHTDPDPILSLSLNPTEPAAAAAHECLQDRVRQEADLTLTLALPQP